VRIRAFTRVLTPAYALWLLGLTLAASAPVLAGCDLSAVVESIEAMPPHGPKPPRLPIESISTDDFPGYLYRLERFPADLIPFPPLLEQRTRIHSIRKLRMLGQGGMGTVYEVEVVYTGGAKRRKAWKELKDTHEAFLKRERRAVIRQYEAANDSDFAGPVDLLLEVTDDVDELTNLGVLFDVGGSPLSRYLEPEENEQPIPLSFSQRLKLAEIVANQMSDVLAKLRKRWVVHGDLKTANIIIFGGDRMGLESPEVDLRALLKEEARVGLIDFGLSLEEGMSFHGHSGTPSYWSPQMVDDYTHRASNDLYALGVILMEILSGKNPKEPSQTYNPSSYPRPGFSASEAEAGLKSLLASDPASAEGGRLEKLKGFILPLLSVDPVKRPREVFVPADASRRP
jgi:serine/threonine protein kinase